MTVTREHLIKPHSIELRRKVSKFVQEVRSEQHAHSETIGAKTIAAIFQENGANVPADEDTEVVIKFSPHTAEIIAISNSN